MNDSSKQAAIRASQLDQLLASNVRTLVASMGLAFILAYSQESFISHRVLIIWLVASVIVNAIRFLFTFHCLRHPVSNPVTIERRLNQFRLGLIVSSLIWGSISFWMFTPEQPKHQVFVIYLLTGLSAAGVVSYSVDIISALCYTLLALVPMMFRLFWFGDELSITMSVAGFLYAGYMIASIRNFNRSLIENIMLRFDAVKREEEIKQLAFYDPLTNLPNRRLLLERLDHAITVSTRSGKRGALLFVDLDHFKELNDTHGHDMGDLLLKKVAERLQRCVRESDTVARLGGDEFVVMLEDLSIVPEEAVTQVEKIANTIIEALNIPYMLNMLEHSSTPSIGVALFGEHGNTHEELLKHADIAMYQAKKAGRNAVSFFDFKMLRKS